MYQVTHPLCRRQHFYTSFDSAIRAFLRLPAGAALISSTGNPILNK